MSFHTIPSCCLALVTNNLYPSPFLRCQFQIIILTQVIISKLSISWQVIFLQPRQWMSIILTFISLVLFFPSQIKSYSRCMWKIHNPLLLLWWYKFPLFISQLNSPLYHIINESREERLRSTSIVFSFILQYQGFILHLPLTKCSQSNSPSMSSLLL